MAISRAQLLKELLPGLNALFGLEYAKYSEETREILTQNLLIVLLKKKPSCPVSNLHLLKTRVLPSPMTMHRKHGAPDTRTKPLQWDSQ